MNIVKRIQRVVHNNVVSPKSLGVVVFNRINFVNQKS
jgi:hypothetical protein